MNCKPGDLAIVTFALEDSNIGKIVTVQKFHGLYAGFPNTWEVDGNVISSGTKRRTRCLAPDEWLRPVSGLPMEEETEQKLKEPA